MLPSAGVLLPGDRVNVQVKFSPAEGRSYSQRLVLSVAQSSQRALLLVQGQGEEPRLEFSSPLLELGPSLPYSTAEEGEVLVQNPCSFPVEFYCLEYDPQYLEEEKILRMMKGYDDKNVPACCPHVPQGRGYRLSCWSTTRTQNALPLQEDQTLSVKEEEENSVGGAKGGVLEQDGGAASPLPPVPGDRNTEEEKTAPLKGGTPSGELLKEREDSKGRVGVGELVTNPVSRALARHMGLDLSPEGQAARNRLGISIIVHGAPLSGKTATAVALAKHYGAACLSIDSVVLEAVSSGGSGAGCAGQRAVCQGSAGARSEENGGDRCLLPEDLLVAILSERLPGAQQQTLYLHGEPVPQLPVPKGQGEGTERGPGEGAAGDCGEGDNWRRRRWTRREYDALSEEEKERVDLQHLEELRERRRREQERAEREEEERRLQEEQERLREEEEQRKKSRKGKKEQAQRGVVWEEEPAGKEAVCGQPAS
ncbi:hypothetical protein SKAU_G00343320 [Synaphobranchus kaupii]|uniref:Hydin adenylate kinase-like domain-containing protein n=1 Tax=Synaphobranchus kaupii TaxID=118154 RepID=A0A9Q1EJ29_SYNKA|nr:hypothetical protein SKAU_G00343320 [Synaphobranchus kaupii]